MGNALAVPTTPEPAIPLTNDQLLCTREVSDLLAVSTRHVKRIAAKFAGARKGIVDGQIGWLVPLSALPSNAQAAYATKHFEPVPGDALDEKVIDSEIYARSPAWARRRADKYLAILQACEGLRGTALMEFVTSWNAANPDKKTSYPCLIDARKKYANEGVSALLAQYGKRAGSTSVADVWYEEFKTLWLSQNAPSAKSCWLHVLGSAKQRDQGIEVSSFPSERAFIKRIDREVPEQAQHMARNGVAAWNKKYANFVGRDDSAIRAGEVWVSDHHQLDVAVIDPDTGKPRFAWVTVWRDYKSGKWLSYLLHCEDPNSDHIFYAFYTACTAHGLPKEILIDNGKDYRCKDFAGGRSRFVKSEGNDDDQKRRTALSLLGVAVHFAAPYNAQAKPVERDFRSLINMFCKFCVGYRGSNVVQRPEKLADEIKAGSILSFSEFEPLFNTFIEESFNNRTSQGKNLLGRSPNQVWESEFTVKREISRDALALFCMRTSGTVSIGRNGVNDSQFGVTYWGEWMSGQKGRKVYMRRDIHDYANAWVFCGDSDEFLGIARAGALSAQAFAKSDVDKSELRQALAAKRKDLRIARAYANAGAPVSIAAHVAAMKTATHATSGGAQEAAPKIHEVTNSAYEKIVRERKTIDETGTADLSLFSPPASRKEEPLFLTETDREVSEQKTA
jgi:putative transposase